jgi:solute carrier family 25 carnitine/acylcarnitine transporter 20/29
MSADFWAGYLSGAVGIIIGNPLDVIKVRRQAQQVRPAAVLSSCSIHSQTVVESPAINQGTSFGTRLLRSYTSLVTGTAAPILGYGALNALLFVSYNRTESALNSVFLTSGNMWNTWIAGAVGGLATWIVSTPTELIKCRAQLASPPMSSLAITKQIWGNHGFKGFYFGGAVTALRDSIGYGFYFWSYELSTRWLATEPDKRTSFQHEAAKVLFCGGLAGVVTWVSVFPLDVIKTRVQTQTLGELVETSPLLRTSGPLRTSRAGALQIAQEAYREGGARVFFRGLTVCSVRAFIVNAVQWAVYEWVMLELGHGRKQAVSNDFRVEMVEAL